MVDKRRHPPDCRPVSAKLHAQAEQIFVFNAVPLENKEERARVEALERAELQRLWSAYPEES